MIIIGMSYFIIIRGPLGCGKTTISNRLAEKLGAEYIAVDRVVDTLLHEHEEGMISQKTFKKANEIIAPTATKVLEQGKPVIFDGNFYWKSQIDDLVERLKDYTHYIFTLKAPLEVCIDRDSKRDNPHGKDAAEAVYNKSTQFTYGTMIDVTKNIDVVLKEIITKIKL